MVMNVIDLRPEDETAYFNCLEEWSDEIREAGDRKERWYRAARGLGLRVKLAVDDAGTVGGMIQYLPIEQSPADGAGLYYILCVWVHGYAKGRGNFQGRGMGTALLAAAEQDARERGATGMAAWGLLLPVFMRSAWFRRRGYRRADRDGMMELVWKPFVDGARPPRFVRQRRRVEPVARSVSVTAFCSGWCPAQNMVCARARQAAAGLGPRVVYREYDTSERPTFAQWGLAEALFIDGKQVRTGPPPSAERLRRAMERRLRRLGPA
jgi:GNAT superfamily N-acetyltransferase